MLAKPIYRFLLCSVLALTAVVANAADRGPSTAEERKQALKYIQDFKANPLEERTVAEREWVFKWITEVPDIHVNVCLILDKLPLGKKKDGGIIFLAQLFSQAELVLNDPSKQSDNEAMYLAGVQGALDVYETLLRANPKDQQKYMDDLLAKRKDGTLEPWVKERVKAACSASK